MEIISRVSSGSKMDQIYIPKHRFGLEIGSYVIIKPLEKEKIEEKPHFYNVYYIEPIKLDIIIKIIRIIDMHYVYENIIFTGSFLEKGFNFNDIDIILIGNNKLDIKEEIEKKIGIKTHIIFIDNKSLIKGLSTDPLYQMMLSKCIAKKRFIYNAKNKINYKILDLHLIKSKTLIDNFDILDGNDKYYLTRNLVSISIYIKGKKISKKIVDSEIKKKFNVNDNDIKQNMLDKTKFIKIYKEIYNKTFYELMEFIKDGAEQK